VKRPSYCCQKCGEQIGWLGRLLWFIHGCNRKANPCNRQLVESAGSVMGDMHVSESTLRFPVTAGSVSHSGGRRPSREPFHSKPSFQQTMKTDQSLKLETRVIKWIIMQAGQPIYSERSTEVEIVDEAAGEFVEVSQSDEGYGKIGIGPDEWPSIRAAIDAAIKQCRDMGGAKP
jgi:hypothetical protein